MTAYPKKRILLDCDPGTDDALAIILALKTASLHLDSITTVNGNVSAEQCTLNALRILAFMCRGDIPVIKGADAPLIVDRVHSAYVFGQDGLGNCSSGLHCTGQPVATDAVSHILTQIKQGEIDTIVATGPLTNIANAYKEDKTLMNSLKEIIVMGGAIHTSGNITAFAEFNFYCDPHAADYVLQNAANLTLIPLDVTTKARFYKKDISGISDLSLKHFIETTSSPWFAFSRSVKQKGISLHDPLALGYAITREFIKTEKTWLNIHLSGEKRGWCEIAAEEKGYPVLYGKEVNATGFKAFFKRSINFSDNPPDPRGA